jgi:hypothetical protein
MADYINILYITKVTSVRYNCTHSSSAMNCQDVEEPLDTGAAREAAALEGASALM